MQPSSLGGQDGWFQKWTRMWFHTDWTRVCSLEESCCSNRVQHQQFFCLVWSLRTCIASASLTIGGLNRAQRQSHCGLNNGPELSPSEILRWRGCGEPSAYRPAHNLRLPVLMHLSICQQAQDQESLIATNEDSVNDPTLVGGFLKDPRMRRRWCA